MAWTITIAGVDQSARVIKRGLSISNARGSRGMMKMGLYDTDSTASAYRPSLDQEVILTDAGTVRFGGVITEVADSPLAGVRSGTKSEVTVTDYSIYLDRALVSTTFAVGTTVKQIAQYLVTNHLAVFGITMDPGMLDGPALTSEYTVLDTLPSEIMNTVTTLNGSVARVTPTKVLQVFLPGAKLAPFNLDGSNCRTAVPWRKARSQYANRILVRFSDGATKAYIFIENRPAPGGTPLAEGEQITLGSTTYTFKSAPTGAGDIQRTGANPSSDMDNLAIAVNNGDALNEQNSQVELLRLTPLVSKARAREAGASGNSIASTTTDPDTFIYGEGAIPRTSLHLGFDEALSRSVAVEDTADVAAKGPWPKRVTADWVYDEGLATEIGAGELRRSMQAPRSLQAGTEAGWALPADALTATFANRMVSGTWVVESVNTRLWSPTRWYHELTLSEGIELQVTWGEHVKQLTSGGSSSQPTSTVLTGTGGGTGSIGPGTPGRLPKWLSPTTIGDSSIAEIAAGGFSVNRAGVTQKGWLTRLSDHSFGFAQNLSFNGATFNLDDTARSGWMARFTGDAGVTSPDTFIISRASAGANPRTPVTILHLTSAAALGLGTATGLATNSITIPNAGALRGVNAANTLSIGLIGLDASDRIAMNWNSQELVVANALTTATAGAILAYLRLNINGTAVKVALLAP